MITASITDQASLTSLYSVGGVIGLILYVIWAIALWRVFDKAGLPGILAIVPIVNVFVWVKVAGYSAWMTLLLIIPIVGWIFQIVLAFRIGRAFGKGGAFSFFLLWLLPVIGYFILGYGRATYTDPS